jgi:hypothetical protein
MNKRFIIALMKVLVLCVVVFSISAYFVYNAKTIGWIIFSSGLLCLAVLRFSNILISHIWPDIIFGIIDNGILAIMAVVGGEIAGVSGAIIGGVVGNAITDGIAGIFEGEIAEKLRESKISEERTMLGSAVGKMAGCLFGAGAVLIVAGLM